MSFLSKLISVAAVVGVFYYFMSPYQNCKRGFFDSPVYEDSDQNKVIQLCIYRTNW